MAIDTPPERKPYLCYLARYQHQSSSFAHDSLLFGPFHCPLTAQKARLLKVCVPRPPLPLGVFTDMPILPSSTPVKNTRNSSTKYSANIQPLKGLHKDMDTEMRKHFVGPMPVRKFLDDFLPVQFPTNPPRVLRGFSSMTNSGSEKEMYNAFVCHCSTILLILCP